MLISDSQRISYRQERRYRYSIVVSVSEKELGDDVQTVAEDALCLPAMFLDLDFPDVTVDVLADIVAPHEGDHHQEQQLADTIQVREMRVFDVEACALQGSEHRLDFPAPAVGFHRFVMAVERHNHLKLRRPVPPLDTPGGEVAGLPFDVVNPGEAHRLPDLQPLEQPVRLGTVALAWVVHPEILLDANVIADVVLVQPPYPLVSDKLAVGEQAVDAFRTEKVDVTLQQGDSFQGVGVAALGQHGEHERVGYPFVCDGEHEDVDVRAAELPVCPVNDQHFLPVAGQERVQESGDEVVVKVEFRKKTLDSPQT